MKILQNNFTTPEQSKKLLELGVPAWSADCYYYEEGGVGSDSTPQVISLGQIWEDCSKETMFSSYVDIPCWSVGRLMEIYYISRDAYSIEYEYYHNTNMIDDMIRRFEIQKGKLDFSKLEE